MIKPRCLIACEFSGIFRQCFSDAGWDSWSCDLLPTEKPGQHYQCDVREVIGQQWDLIIAHPDCQYITNSGVRWLDRDIARWKQLWEACEFFRLFLNHPCPHICIENPIPHKYAARWIGQPYTMTFQPWEHGHTESKRTALWLRGLPALRPSNNVKHQMAGMKKSETDKVHYASPGPDRWKERSRSYEGVGRAMAEQWTAHILNLNQTNV